MYEENNYLNKGSATPQRSTLGQESLSMRQHVISTKQQVAICFERDLIISKYQTLHRLFSGFLDMAANY